MASFSRVRVCAAFRVRATCGARRAGVSGGCRPFELDPGFNYCRPIVLSSAPKTEVDARLLLGDRALLEHIARNALVQLVWQLSCPPSKAFAPQEVSSRCKRLSRALAPRMGTFFFNCTGGSIEAAFWRRLSIEFRRSAALSCSELS